MSTAKRKLDIDLTRDRLLALALPNAAAHLDLLLSEAVKQETAPHAFLDQLLDAEHQGRESRRVEGRSDREIRRCLKRFVARRIFRLLEGTATAAAA